MYFCWFEARATAEGTESAARGLRCKSRERSAVRSTAGSESNRMPALKRLPSLRLHSLRRGELAELVLPATCPACTEFAVHGVRDGMRSRGTVQWLRPSTPHHRHSLCDGTTTLSLSLSLSRLFVLHETAPTRCPQALAAVFQRSTMSRARAPGEGRSRCGLSPEGNTLLSNGLQQAARSKGLLMSGRAFPGIPCGGFCGLVWRD